MNSVGDGSGTASSDKTAGKPRKRRNPGCVMLVLALCLVVSPFLFTMAICYPSGNPPGCGDIILAFGPFALVAMPLGLIGLVVAIVVGIRRERDRSLLEKSSGRSETE